MDHKLSRVSIRNCPSSSAEVCYDIGPKRSQFSAQCHPIAPANPLRPPMKVGVLLQRASVRPWASSPTFARDRPTGTARGRHFKLVGPVSAGRPQPYTWISVHAATFRSLVKRRAKVASRPPHPPPETSCEREPGKRDLR